MDRYITVLKKEHIPNSLFSHIIYIPKKGDNVIVEDTTSGNHVCIDQFHLNNFIKIDSAYIPFSKLINGDYVGVRDNKSILYTKVIKDLQKYWITIKLNSQIPENIEDSILDNSNVRIIDADTVEFNLPLLPLWVGFRKYHYNDEYTVTNVCMEYNNIFYRVPYGNVSANDHLCMGGMTLFKSIEHFLYNFLTMPFKERDYGCLLKNTDKSDAPVLFDLSLIKEYIDKNINISTFSMLYYISNIEDLTTFDFTKIFYQRAKPMWRED